MPIYKVVSAVGGIYSCLGEDKIIHKCHPLGAFRHQNKNILIGDLVEINDLEQIINILPRKNSLIRPRIANLDIGIIVAPLKSPDYNSYLVDKYLTLLNMSLVTPLIILSKLDLEKDLDKVNDIKKYYEQIGIKVIPFSSKTKEGLEEIKKTIDGKTVAFMGQSGVGKSSLINVIDENYARNIGEFKLGQGRGQHMTKEVIILPYLNGFIADTPGFSSLELPLFKEDLATYFPGFKPYLNCKFNNCLHISESDCGVKKAVNNGKISLESYNNYKAILEELKFRKDRY